MAKDIFGKTALDYSVEHHHKQCSKILLRKTIYLPQDSKEDPNENLLHLACKSSHEIVVGTVLKAEKVRIENKYPNSRLLSWGRNSQRLTPLDLAAKQGHLRNLTEILLVLKSSDKDIKILQDAENQTPLHWAISARNLMCCVVIIDYESKRQKMFRDMWSNIGETAEIRQDIMAQSGLLGNVLRYAIQCQCAQACTIIMEVNRKDFVWPLLGRIASAEHKSVNFGLLMDSLKFSLPGILQLLLEEVESLELGLCSLIVTPAQTPEWYPKHTQSREASSKFPYDRRLAVKAFLSLLKEEKDSSEVALVKGFKTMFLYMLEHGQVEMLKVFLSTSVKEPDALEVLLVDALGKLDLSILELASQANSPQTTRLILDYIKHFRLGALLSVSEDGRSWLLEMCIMSNHASALRYLLECYTGSGVDVATLIQDSVDRRTGLSLVHRAAAGGYTDCLRLLFSFGAKPTARKSHKDGVEEQSTEDDFAGITTILYEVSKN